MAIDANNDETDDVQVANDKLKTRLIIKSLFSLIRIQVHMQHSWLSLYVFNQA